MESNILSMFSSEIRHDREGGLVSEMQGGNRDGEKQKERKTPLLIYKKPPSLP
jgi:hypothetical protein